MKPSELLEKHGWCQHVCARDANGGAVDPCDRSAVSWCVMGALFKCIQPEEHNEACKKLRQVMKTGHFGDWNDAPGRTKEEAIEALRNAGL